MIAAKGISNIEGLIATLRDNPTIPKAAQEMFEQMRRHVSDLDVKIMAVNSELLVQHKTNVVSQCLGSIPGIGPITAITVALSVNPVNFDSGRHFAA